MRRCSSDHASSPQVLAASTYPLGFPKVHRVSYQADTGDLPVEIDLSLEGVVPAARAYRYVKTRDEIMPVPRPEKERKELYASVLAQTALRTVHDLFAADTEGVVRSSALNGHVATIDRATGRDVHPCLITLQTDQDEFSQLVLTQVDPRACLKRLRSMISPNPHELEPVRPLVTSDLSKFRLMDSLDVVAGIGLDSVNTQPSKDEGVDAVAMNTDPVMKGLCVIQAKRTKNVVPFETVPALAGVVEHKRAAKGILVTTSWFGRTSEAFANEHGRLELLDGANLVWIRPAQHRRPDPKRTGVSHAREPCRAEQARLKHLQYQEPSRRRRRSTSSPRHEPHRGGFAKSSACS